MTLLDPNSRIKMSDIKNDPWLNKPLKMSKKDIKEEMRRRST
jgi:hypothetical protein